ncbi:MAG: hypothetical protein HFJ47_00250 [Clostridia bacterium]|nr:hypothetical protein [Clostridia bacterium]
MKNIKKIIALLIIIVLVILAVVVIIKKSQVNIEIPAEEEKAMAVVGDQQTFDYTGGIQTYKVPVTGIYQLSAYGADGGYDMAIEKYYYGGKGGYATGQVHLEARRDTIYICWWQRRRLQV